jgi:predicted methyltransferase
LHDLVTRQTRISLPHVPRNQNYRVLKNGGKLEVAQHMAAHESARTTGLYDRRGDEISLDEVERIAI